MRPGAPSWLADYIDSMAGFPNAAHDDEVDSTTQALNYMIGRGGGTGILDYYPAMARTPTAEPGQCGYAFRKVWAASRSKMGPRSLQMITGVCAWRNCRYAVNLELGQERYRILASIVS